VRYPDHVYLLFGRYEHWAMARQYHHFHTFIIVDVITKPANKLTPRVPPHRHNLYRQCLEVYGSGMAFELILMACRCLPFAAVVNDKVACVHACMRRSCPRDPCSH
jgi:hypothetical protein